MHGDVDILAGSLNWDSTREIDEYISHEHAEHPEWHITRRLDLAARKLASRGGIQWPPSVEFLVGVEAKCAYLPRNAETVSVDAFKSTKLQPRQQRRIRLGVDKLLELGLNHALLLDILATPPVSGPDGGAWITSLDLADRSEDVMAAALEQRLHDNCEVAHWIWSIGSVVGGDEFSRGAATFLELRSSNGNSRLPQSAQTREDIQSRLTALLSHFGKPTAFPAVFVDCKSCRRLHHLPWDGSGCSG
jgi:hypothetical protein